MKDKETSHVIGRYASPLSTRAPRGHLENGKKPRDWAELCKTETPEITDINNEMARQLRRERWKFALTALFGSIAIVLIIPYSCKLAAQRDQQIQASLRKNPQKAIEGVQIPTPAALQITELKEVSYDRLEKVLNPNSNAEGPIVPVVEGTPDMMGR